ncbi:hypothetical protein GCM10009678_24300 [Actinomadura kijaniata]
MIVAMPRQRVPPRPIAPGDIVTRHSPILNAWVAAQITHLDPEAETAAVLTLDWSGPEPATVADLGDVAPLVLTHHAWNGRVEHCHHEWVLPRGFKVIGALPLLRDQPPNAYSHGWRVDDQLARQRHWDTGDHGDLPQPWKATRTAAELDHAPEITDLTVRRITTLDCGLLVERHPHLTDLSLHGDLGLLTAAERLNELASLQRLRIVNLFGMTGHDRLLPERVPALESLLLSGIPTGYATAMRRAWKPQIPHGVHVDIRRARKPEWVAENRDNPLRDWDGRERIGRTRYTKAVAQYRRTRRAVLEALTADDPRRLVEIGREYGEAFNALDRRTGFIETVEREELFTALDHLVDQAETTLAQDLTWARESLIAGVEQVRDW